MRKWSEIIWFALIAFILALKTQTLVSYTGHPSLDLKSPPTRYETDRENDGYLMIYIAKDIPLLHAIHQKPIKLEPNQSDQCSDIDIIKAVDFHLDTEVLKGHAYENRR